MRAGKKDMSGLRVNGNALEEGDAHRKKMRPVPFIERGFPNCTGCIVN